MPEAIPDDITREDVLAGIDAYVNGADHDFADSIAYDLLHEGKRYPPKAILGLAATRLAGRVLKPADFSGGESSKCFRILRGLGFEVVKKPGAEETGYAVITENDESQWHDETGVKYHFPKTYAKLLESGTQVVYYKGRMQDAVHLEDRLSKAPHYFGTAIIGRVYDDPASTKGDLYCEIVDFQEFNSAVLAKVGEKEYLEEIPPSRVDNYWRNGVRGISPEVYERIIEAAIGQGAIAHDPLTESIILSTEEGSGESHWEGALKTSLVNRYERDRKARNKCVAHHKPICAVCEFDFFKAYGAIGRGFIHVHHLKDLSTIGAEYQVDPINDLIPVCPNCHAMLHTTKPAMCIKDLRSVMETRKGVS